MNNYEPKCPECGAPLLQNGECPFDDCASAVPEWMLLLDDEYLDEPITELPGP